MTTTRRTFLKSSIAATAAAGFPAPAVLAQSATVELKLSSFVPPMHSIWAGVLTPWVKEVASKSDGRLKISSSKPWSMRPCNSRVSSGAAKSASVMSSSLRPRASQATRRRSRLPEPSPPIGIQPSAYSAIRSNTQREFAPIQIGGPPG